MVFCVLAGFMLVNGVAFSTHAGDVAAHVPARAPRTAVLQGQRRAFRGYCCIVGEGAKAFGKIKADFDKEYVRFPFPA